MKLTSCLLAAPLTLLLTVGGVEAKDQGKSKKNHVTQKVDDKDKATEKEFKRSTEGHRPQDLNGDGTITRNEWPGNDVSFKELDTDGDGSLTKRDKGYAAEGNRTRTHERPVNDYKKPAKR